MSAIQSLFQQAQLAEAAYADFPAFPTSVTDALKGSGFSDTQAIAFVNEWNVVDHVPDTVTGFSATIFRNRQTGAYALAIRGTRATSLTDILNDTNY